jgi:hypothetical protein
VWTLDANASGASIDQASGKYVAGATPSVTDVVRVTDAVGAHESIQVKVGVGVTVTPITSTVVTGGHISFDVSGGSGMGYAWSLASNQSGATIDAGSYVAGTKANTMDIVAVKDSLGNGASATVHVSPAASSNPTGGDAGVPVGGDVSPDAGDVSEAVPVPPSSGCGCAVVGAEPSEERNPFVPLGAGLALVAVVAARVQRRRSRATAQDMQEK